MIEEDYLGVLFTFYFSTSADASLLSWVQIWVHVDHFSVTTVPEKETSVRVGIDLEIRRVLERNLLAFPRVITQIGSLRLDLFSF